MSTFELSICTVCSNNEDYLNLNKQVSKIDVPYKWYVIQDTKVDRLTDTRLEAGFIHVPDGDNWTEIDGVAQNSVQHGDRLNRMFAWTKSRFVLFLDPDFFIFYPVSQILQRMVDNGLFFFGAPYHESSTHLLRDFPVAYCMFVDMGRMLRKEVNLLPGYGDIKSDYYPDVGYRIYSKYAPYKASYQIALPSVPKGASFQHTTQSLKDFGIHYENPKNDVGTKIDEFFFENKLFGVHTRAKLNQKRNKNTKRIKHQLSVIKYINENYHSPY